MVFVELDRGGADLWWAERTSHNRGVQCRIGSLIVGHFLRVAENQPGGSTKPNAFLVPYQSKRVERHPDQGFFGNFMCSGVWG
jgi:hypothetical protein